MASVSQSITKLLTEAAASSALAATLGADSEQTSRIVELGAPALVGGLADRAAEPGGVDTIATMVRTLNAGDEDGPSLLEDLEGFVAGATPEGGADLLSEVFGSDQAAVVGAIAEQGQVPESTVDQALPILAPIAVAELGRRKIADDLDDDGLRALLVAEKAELAEHGPFDFGWLTKVAVGVGAGAAVGSVIAETGTETGTGAGSGTVVADPGADEPEPVDETDEFERIPAADRTGQEPQQPTEATDDEPRDQDERDRSPVGLIGLAVGWLAAVLLVGWGLSLLDGSNGQEVAGDRNPVVEQDTATDSDDADTETDANGDGTTAGTGGESSGNEDAPTDDTDGATDSESATEGEVDAAAVLAEATASLGSVDADVSVSVSDNGTAILTGVAQSQQARSAAEAAVRGVDGVVSVVNRIEIEPEGGTGTKSDTGVADGDTSSDEPTTINDELDLGPITFSIASATITSAGRVVLDETVEYLEQNSDVLIEIAGHTDASGSEATNQSLSQERADAVKAYLESAGIDGDRMTTKGYGASQPVASNDTAVGRAENRRIEFVFK